MADFRFAPHPFHLRAERLNGFVRLFVSGELDLSTAWYLEESLVRLQQEGAIVIVDVGELTFMGAVGLRLLLDAARRARSRHGVLVIVNCDRPARRILELTSTLDLLDAWEVSELFDDDRDWTPMQLTPPDPANVSSIEVGA
jgi:anti-anti-sigma factor